MIKKRRKRCSIPMAWFLLLLLLLPLPVPLLVLPYCCSIERVHNQTNLPLFFSFIISPLAKFVNKMSIIPSWGFNEGRCFFKDSVLFFNERGGCVFSMREGETCFFNERERERRVFFQWEGERCECHVVRYIISIVINSEVKQCLDLIVIDYHHKRVLIMKISRVWESLKIRSDLGDDLWNLWQCSRCRWI